MPELINKQDRDVDTGLVRMGVRYYSPEIGQFTTPDPLFLEQPNLCISRPVECNLYSYARNNPLKYIDSSGLLTVIVGGTFAQNESWTKPTSAFSKAVRKSFGQDKTTVAINWSPRNVSGNTVEGRSKGAKLLANTVNSHKFSAGEKLFIVAHSHGGNVVKEYSNMSESRYIDTLVNLGTPQRNDYSINSSKIGFYLNVYSNQDKVQPIGGRFPSLFGPAGRTDPKANLNFESKAPGHSELHSTRNWEPINEILENRPNETKPWSRQLEN